MEYEKLNGKTNGSGIKGAYHHYRERGLFRYVGRNVLLIILAYSFFIFLVFMAGRYLVDFNSLFEGMISSLPDRFVIVLFFVSESITGMIPVDLFVIWAQKFDHPMNYLALLGILSYTGGIISYQIGLWISSWPKVKAYIEKRLRSYIGFVRKWGGAFIVIAALFPFTPFSLVVIAITMLRYPFRLFLLFGLARLVRFVIQGALFFNLLNIDQWIF